MSHGANPTFAESHAQLLKEHPDWTSMAATLLHDMSHDPSRTSYERATLSVLCTEAYQREDRFPTRHRATLSGESKTKPASVSSAEPCNAEDLSDIWEEFPNLGSPIGMLISATMACEPSKQQFRHACENTSRKIGQGEPVVDRFRATYAALKHIVA